MAANATETLMRNVVPLAGTLKTLYCRAVTAPGSGGSGKTRTMTLRVNGASPASGPACTISETATTCNDTTNSATVSAGDTVDFIENTANTPASSATSCGIGYRVSSATSIQGILSNSAGATIASGDFLPLMGNGHNTTETNMKSVAASAGTLQNLYCNLVTTPGVGATQTFTVRQNASNTSLTCNMSGNGPVACNDTNGAHAVTVAVGDFLDIATTVSGSPAASAGSCAMEFDASGGTVKSMLSGGNGTAAAPANNAFSLAGQPSVGGGEDDFKAVSPANATLQNLYCAVTVAPGAGTSVQYVLRINNASSTSTCTISNTSTSCTDTTHSPTVVAGDEIHILPSITGSPASSHASCSVEWVP